MGQIVFVVGTSGTGKSYSWGSFNTDEIAVINCEGKLPSCEKEKPAFKCKKVNTDRSSDIVDKLKELSKRYKSIIIDDFQSVMTNENMRRALEKGYDKWIEMAKNVWDIMESIKALPDDIIVYILCHTDISDDGREKIKTQGKMIDNCIVLESKASIVLKTGVQDGKYFFTTQNNGKDTVKSPAGMFSTYAINNDLKYVDEKIRNYYELGELYLSDSEIAEIDEINKNLEIEPPKSRSERKQRKSREQVQADNSSKVAYAGIEESGDAEEVPFEEVETPKVETTPRRRRVRTE